MLKTKEELFNSNSAVVVISTALGKELYEDTKNTELNDLVNLSVKNNKDSVVLKQSLISKLRDVEHIEKDKSLPPKNKGGRPRLPDVSTEDMLKLEAEGGKELLKVQNRAWKRQSRERLARKAAEII